MPNFQLQDSQNVPYAIAEYDAKGNIEAPGSGDSVSVTSDSTGSLTVQPDDSVDPAKLPAGADPADYLQTGLLIGGSTPKNGVQVTATFAHSDGSPAPDPVTDLIDVIVGAIKTGAIILGTPVNQP